ncbi:MAG: TonB family protein [Gemmatimonadota bacterium]|nr:TonB family protein [Gemmatimonadota bacterium]
MLDRLKQRENPGHQEPPPGKNTSVAVTLRRWLEIPVNILRENVRQKNYDRLFRWSISISMVLFFLAAWVTVLFLPEDGEIDLFAPQKELLAISPHTLIVINAVQRTSLAKRRVKVPRYKPVELAMKELDVPKPEIGSLDIGPEIPEITGPVGRGSPHGTARTRPPNNIRWAPPVYPKKALKKKIEGRVLLRLHITISGTVDRIEVASGSGDKSLDEAAIKAARKSLWNPAIKDGKKTATWTTLPFDFRLPQKKK